MSDFPLQKFIDLIEYDQSIMNLEKNIEQFQYEIDESTNKVHSCLESVENMRLTKQAFQKEVHAKELEMKSVDEQEKEKKQKLESLENYQEYGSIKSEINNLKKKQRSLEEELVDAWKKFESFEISYEERRKFCQEEENALQTVISQKMQQIEKIKKELANCQIVRKQKEVDIPQDWLIRYANLRTKIMNPVVPLQNESCSACFYKVPQRDLADLRNKQLLSCRDCFRFLYLK